MYITIKRIDIIKNKYLILFGLVFASFVFHLVGCFYLYDFAGDEGWWLINAKNYCLFKNFFVGGDYHMPASPLNTFLHIPFFYIFGPSIWLGRIISIFFSIFTLILFFIFVDKHYGLNIAIISSYIIAVNAILNRLTTFAYVESKVHFFMILALYLWFSDKRWMKNLALLSLFFVVGFKLNSIFFVIPFIYAFIYDKLSEKKDRKKRFNYSKGISKDVLKFILFVFLIVILPFCIAYLIKPTVFLFLVKTLFNRCISVDLLRNLLNANLLKTVIYNFQYTPITIILLLIGTIFVILVRNKNGLDRFLLCWIFAEVCFYVFWKEVHTRYILNLIFPTSIFIGKLFIYLLNKSLFLNKRFFNLSKLLVIILLIIIGIKNIIGSFYYFMILKPEKYTIEASNYLMQIQQKYNYKTILCPPAIAVSLPFKTFSIYYYKITDFLQKEKLEFPILCILEKERAKTFNNDEIFLFKIKVKPLKIIGNFWFYEIPKNSL
jgi:hypothetical protein